MLYYDLYMFHIPIFYYLLFDLHKFQFNLILFIAPYNKLFYHVLFHHLSILPLLLFFCYFIIILIYLILAFYHFTNFHYIIHFKILDLIFIHFFNHYTNFPHNRNFHLHYSTIFQILIFFHFSSALDKYIRPLLMNKY